MMFVSANVSLVLIASALLALTFYLSALKRRRRAGREQATRLKHQQQLQHLTHFDPLTHLPNRSLLGERLRLGIAAAHHQQRKVAVLFLDIDRFRDINEQLGPAIADRILRMIAKRLQTTLPGHTLARLGGDEFAVMLEHFDDENRPETLAREIFSAFDSPLEVNPEVQLTVSFSIGISLYPDHALTPDELIQQADIAMYQAKAAGWRTFMRYDHEMDSQSRQRTAISSHLGNLLERGELALAFQPRLHLASGRIAGVEVLLRWFSHEHGEISPEDFIPLAEAHGMMADISAWTLKQACLTLQDWRKQGLDDVMMSLNVSALQLMREDCTQMVQSVLDETGIPPKALELELTESLLMADIEQASDKLQAFRELGISVAVDDFGTGYSSLAWLKQLPVTTLKMDKAFIHELPGNGEDAAIATSIIRMGHSLGLSVVAEGVETDAQRQFLQAQGCDEIQGYWLAKPMPGEQALAFIQRWLPETVSCEEVLEYQE